MHHVRHIVMSNLVHEAEHEAGYLHAPELHQKTPAGTLINAGLAVALLEKYVGEITVPTQETILLEGFPPSVEQAQKYLEEAQRYGAKVHRRSTEFRCKND